MSWNEIKTSIVNDFLGRNLKTPKIRLHALDNIERKIQLGMPHCIENPKNFKIIGKEKFTEKIIAIKGSRLNGAEKSVINEIYKRTPQ